MEIKRYHSNGRMSMANIHNGTIYLAGQTAKNKEQPVAGQTAEILANLDKILAEHGSDKNHILSALIHLHDFSSFDEMNGVWDQWIEAEHAPARTCVGAVDMAAGSLVEITVVAAVK